MKLGKSQAILVVGKDVNNKIYVYIYIYIWMNICIEINLVYTFIIEKMNYSGGCLSANTSS